MDRQNMEALANDIRIDIVKMIARAGSGHPGGSLSAADILTALYFGDVMSYDPHNPHDPERDRFVLAKGHAAPVLYATLAHAGFFPTSELSTLRKLGSRLQGHPDCNLLPGVDVSTGSLGQGLSIACGMAAGFRLDTTAQTVFALLGDGECQEGQVWEAAMFAAHQKLDNLVAIVDRNELQIDGNTRDVCDPGDIGAKFASFGWDVHDVDGHDIAALTTLLRSLKADRSAQPHVIIAHTIKGKGVAFMENVAGWHGKAPNEEQLIQAVQDLGVSEASAKEIASAAWDNSADSADAADVSEAFLAAVTHENGLERGAAPRVAIDAPRLADSAEGVVRKATRAAYGETLAALADEGAAVVAVDADLSGSTTTAKFAAANEAYAKRLFNVGIAEQNMVDVASGLALTGKVAFTGSFAVFGTGRAYDQIRNTVCYSNLNVKIAPTHAGISVGPDGGSHQMLEDISLMRGLPHMKVLVPADYASAAAALRLAAQTDGPAYVRMGRASVPCIYASDVELRFGGSYVLREGSDVTLVACGVEVEQALNAADALHQQGIEAEVIDAYSIKPLDASTILASVRKTGCIVCAEEHSRYGGLCSAVAEVLAKALPAPLECVAVDDCFGKSGDYAELSAFFKIDAHAIENAVKRVIARR